MTYQLLKVESRAYADNGGNGMKRTVITVDGNGMLSIPSNLQDLWMSEGELVDMLHVTAMKLHAVIRSIYKDGLLTVSEV